MSTFATRSAMFDLPAPNLPAPIRWYNRRRAGKPWRIDAEALLEAAGGPFDDRVKDGTRRLCASLRGAGTLHPFGQLYARTLISGALAVRARLDRYFTAHPELEEQPLHRPLVVYGLQRSGTTFLHRLLAEGDGARGLALWELMQPVPPERGPDLRRLATTAIMRGFRMTAPPTLDAMHFMRPGLADECQFILRLDLRSPVLWTALAALSYAEWLFDEDMEVSCRLYRRVLQLFQAQDPSRRLVLKNPGHTLYAEALLQALPEAAFVQTHRDPLATLPSQCKLTLTAQSAMTEGVDPAAVVDTVTHMQGRMAMRSVDLADTPAGDRVMHVRYPELVAEPMTTVRRIHERFDLPWGAAQAARMTAHLRRNTQHRRGKNPYSIEQFGLDRDQLGALFGDYRGRFLGET